MAILTATPNPALGTIAITVDDGTGVTGIMRYDANGVRLLRTHAGDLPSPGLRSFTDYEAALSGAIQYRIQGAPGEAVWTQIGAKLPRFHLPRFPHSTLEADLVHGYSAARTSRATVHEIIGKSSPVVNEAGFSLRSGTLDVWFAEYIGARDLDALLSRGFPLMYRQAEHPGLDMYFYGTESSISPDEGSWKLSLGYRETSYPAGDLLSPEGWSFTALAAAGGTFTATAAGYGSFSELATGDPV